MEKYPRLMIGVCTLGNPHWMHYTSMFLLANSMGGQAPMLVTVPRRNTVEARQIIYTQFKNFKEFAYLLWVDDDISFLPQDVEALFQCQKDFVCGCYKWRRDDTKLAYHKNGKIINYEDVKNTGLIEIDSGGLGFCLMTRKCLIGDYKFWRKVGEEQDVNFMRELKKRGNTLWLNTDILVTHIAECAIHKGVQLI